MHRIIVCLYKKNKFTNKVNDNCRLLWYNKITADIPLPRKQGKIHLTERKIIMTINKTKKGNALTIAIEGRVDTVTAPELEKSVNESIDSVESIVLDFAKVEYISSAGLRVLLSTHKSMMKKGGMKIVNAGEDIMEIFEVTGFSDILTIA